MKKTLVLGDEFITAYKHLMTVIQAEGDPPCIDCSDTQIIHCAKTDYQCALFSTYVESISNSLRASPPGNLELRPSPFSN